MVKPRQHRIRKDGRLAYVREFEYDPSPLYAVDVSAGGHVQHFMAFDPKYGPENEAQIEWHVAHATPGASHFEVGKPL